MRLRSVVRPVLRGPALALVCAPGLFALLQCTSKNDAAPVGGDAASVACADDAAATTPSPMQTASPDGSVTTPPPSMMDAQAPDAGAIDPVKAAASQLIDQGRQTFRYGTFGDEDFWGNTLKLHTAIEGAGFDGGVGTGVSPQTALAVGLKIDVDALPSSVVTALQGGTLDLTSPATTLAVLQLNAVVGVTGVFDTNKNLTSVGIQCALCHSTVDDSLTKGIGHRLDGWANRDLNVGAIVNLSPDLSSVATLLGVPEATVRTVLQSWAPGSSTRSSSSTARPSDPTTRPRPRSSRRRSASPE